MTPKVTPGAPVAPVPAVPGPAEPDNPDIIQPPASRPPTERGDRPKRTPTPADTERPPAANAPPLQCMQCGGRFQSRQELEAHERRGHTPKA